MNQETQSTHSFAPTRFIPRNEWVFADSVWVEGEEAPYCVVLTREYFGWRECQGILRVFNLPFFYPMHYEVVNHSRLIQVDLEALEWWRGQYRFHVSFIANDNNEAVFVYATGFAVKWIRAWRKLGVNIGGGDNLRMNSLRAITRYYWGPIWIGTIIIGLFIAMAVGQRLAPDMLVPIILLYCVGIHLIALIGLVLWGLKAKQR